MKALRVLEKPPHEPVAAALLNAGLGGDISRREATALPQPSVSMRSGLMCACSISYVRTAWARRSQSAWLY